MASETAERRAADPAPNDWLYSLPEVGRRLGVHLSTVYDLIDRGMLTAVHMDGLARRPLRVRASSLTAYMDRLRVAGPLKVSA